MDRPGRHGPCCLKVKVRTDARKLSSESRKYPSMQIQIWTQIYIIQFYVLKKDTDMKEKTCETFRKAIALCCGVYVYIFLLHPPWATNIYFFSKKGELKKLDRHIAVKLNEIMLMSGSHPRLCAQIADSWLMHHISSLPPIIHIMDISSLCFIHLHMDIWWVDILTPRIRYSYYYSCSCSVTEKPG